MNLPPRGKPHTYVEMPQSDSAYGPAPLQGLSTRDQLIRRYGEVSVMHAEVAVCVTIMTELGLIRRSEFVDLVKSALAAADRRRQLTAERGGA